MECEYSSLTSALAFTSRLCHIRRCGFEAGDAPPPAVGSQRVRRTVLGAGCSDNPGYSQGRQHSPLPTSPPPAEGQSEVRTGSGDLRRGGGPVPAAVVCAVRC